jgi:hypothetical protein
MPAGLTHAQGFSRCYIQTQRGNFSGLPPMGRIPKPCFVLSMNRRNAARTKKASTRKTKTSPLMLQLRVKTSGGSSWTVPLEKNIAALARRHGKNYSDKPVRLELSLIRSVAAAGLRRSSSIWGR